MRGDGAVLLLVQLGEAARLGADEAQQPDHARDGGGADRPPGDVRRHGRAD